MALEGRRLVELADQAGLTARLLGGVAILLHCQHAEVVGGYREIADLDLVVAPGHGRGLAQLLVAEQYRPEARFNALHGAQRMIFHGPLGQLDVMIGVFEMCHRINLADRLILDQPTIPVTDLLVTKMQIVHLNQKDALDIQVLLTEHDLTREDGDSINLNRLEALVRSDWGLWRTMVRTLDRLDELDLGAEIRAKTVLMRDSIQSSSKTLQFKLRAKVGDRVVWYVLPDEVAR